jgi:hypothetical protein
MIGIIDMLIILIKYSPMYTYMKTYYIRKHIQFLFLNKNLKAFVWHRGNLTEFYNMFPQVKFCFSKFQATNLKMKF